MQNYSDANPSTKADLETKLQQVVKEMMEAGRARKFRVAQRKEEELQKLATKKLRMSMPSEDPEENIKVLNAKIDQCINERRWIEAQSLQQVVTDISRQVEFSNRRVDDENTENIDSDAGRGLPIYGHLSILQAHPLVWYDGKNFQKFLLPPDFEHEKKTIVDALNHAKKNGGHIDVSFEAATTFRLSALLADPENRMLHYSGHGNKGYVTMENWGVMQQLNVDELKEFVSTGTGNLRFAFVSACHSEDVGNAFVKAGVSHVVCCHLCEQLDDVAAIEFTRNFYLHLACGQPLSKAFKMAQEATKIAPFDQDAKFMLLPKKDDDYHNVQLFSTTPINNNYVSANGNHPSIGMPPSPPSPFIGREMEMYKVLEHLKNSRLTQITGVPGIGKSAMGHALCAYICERKKDFLIDEVFWLSSVVRSLDRDELSGIFSELMAAIMNEKVLADNKLIRQSSELIAELLRDRRALIFIDGRRMSSPLAMTKLQLFLEILLRSTMQVYVVLICASGEEIISKVIPSDVHLKLGPLDMESSVKLFAKNCPFVAEKKSKEVSTPMDLVSLLVPDSQADATHITPAMSKRCEDIFVDVGEGNPEGILKAAREMSLQKYLELVDMGKRQEFQRSNYDTRFALDQAWRRIAEKLEMSIDGYDFQQAKQYKADLQELEQLRRTFPPLEELRLREKDICARRNHAVSKEDFTTANELQKELSELRKKINREEEAQVGAAGNGGVRNGDLQESNSFDKVSGSTGLSSTRGNLEYIVPSPEELLPDDVGSFTLSIVQMSVTEFRHSNSSSVIVCATNESCHPVRGSVSGAVIEAGGDAFKKEVDNLESEEETHWGPVRCPTGNAVIVGPAALGYYGKLNVPWVIFAVGPTYARDDGKDSLKQKDAVLRSAYRYSLELAKKNGLEAVAFSLISCGHRAGGDLRRPLRIAVEVIRESGYKELKKVQLCAYMRREADILNEVALEMGLSRVLSLPNS